jgi:hypothetical protein
MFFGSNAVVIVVILVGVGGREMKKKGREEVYRTNPVSSTFPKAPQPFDVNGPIIIRTSETSTSSHIVTLNLHIAHLRRELN